ncbi:hypothetical protein NC653_018136 [Populus alba x Populus x berolinensis]|uniref:Uncharacterized protein n=1 Tax=Populus alba x Populus x berolinensis TaxID=444605 RepID=A0AAD6QSF9_9ROSI|nr:hypothetical protein NC653_041206 [Populus alba x Populus x berolinensis]KAJ6995593.1 hypothetical protein NC653_018136 [Populus alba x Populus x berolinensis]
MTPLLKLETAAYWCKTQRRAVCLECCWTVGEDLVVTGRSQKKGRRGWGFGFFFNVIEWGTSGEREKKGEGERLVSSFWPRLGTVSSGLVEGKEKVWFFLLPEDRVSWPL